MGTVFQIWSIKNECFCSAFAEIEDEFNKITSIDQIEQIDAIKQFLDWLCLITNKDVDNYQFFDLYAYETDVMPSEPPALENCKKLINGALAYSKISRLH
jgi:hypothetical protein